MINGYSANFVNGNASWTSGPVVATYAAGCVAGTFGRAAEATTSLYRVTFGSISAFYGWLANVMPGSSLNNTPPPPPPTSSEQSAYGTSGETGDWVFPTNQELEAQAARELAGLLSGLPGPSGGQATRYVD